MKRIIYILCALVLVCTGCEKDRYDVTTITKTEITPYISSADVTIYVAEQNGNTSSATIEEVGVFLSTQSEPTTNDERLSVSNSEEWKSEYSFPIEGLASNTTYYALPFVANSLGILTGQVVSFTTARTDMPEKVDLGLPSGIKWASMNVGANAPYDYGYYFQWGCTNGEYQEGWDLYCHGNKNAITKYCTNSTYGTVDNLTTLLPEDDAAHLLLGENWRIPTKEEAGELWNNCTRTWETNGDISGYRFTGPNGNSIFLPSNGWWDEQGEVHSLNVDGLYWTSSLSEANNNSAWGFITRKTTGNAGVLAGPENRHYARGIRAVCP